MIRKIDKYNRVGIPKHMQKSLGLKCGECVDIQFDDNKIIIYPTPKENLRSFMNDELKRYKQMLNEAKDEKEIYLFNGLIIELYRLIEKYDEFI